MRRSRFAHWTSVILAFGCSAALSAARAETKGDPATDPFWHRPILFVGGDAGYNFISTDAAAELDKHGWQLDAKGLVSYSWTHVTADAGAGWLYNNSTGSAKTGAVLHDELTTKAAFVRLAGRYRFTPRWELGLLNHILCGADTRFQTTLAKKKNANWLLGLEAVYRIPFRFPLQFSGAFLTDATISNRQVYQFLFGVQVGIPLLGSRAKAKEPAKPVEEPPPVPIPTPEPAPTCAPTPVPTPAVTRTYVFDVKHIQFDYDSAKVRPESLPMLRELGFFMGQHAEAWGSLIVEGHTDRRGTAAYNQRLSQHRADAVRDILLAQGLRNSSVRTVGYGFVRPVVDEATPKAWQQNRRVEFKLEGIREPALLDDFFRQLKRED